MKPLPESLLYQNIELAEVDPFEQPELYLELLTKQKIVPPQAWFNWFNERNRAKEQQ